MEKMGFNKKSLTWQVKYKMRKRVGSRPVPISKKANRLYLNMSEIGEESKEDKSKSMIELSIQS
jgi:hypothetical protein